MEDSMFHSIIKECPRFRILTSGKVTGCSLFNLTKLKVVEQSGVGKTTLIKKTFDIEALQASDKDPGKCNIEDEIFSSENENFVLHDSQGFEPGEVKNFNAAKTFIQDRAQEPLIKDQLHAVWLCLQIPSVGGRLIEAGDEEFLKLPFGDLPIVIVFTQYDRLYKQFSYDLGKAGKLKSKDPEEKKRVIKQESERYFQEHCINQLDKLQHLPKRLKWVSVSSRPEYHDTLKELVSITLDLVRNHVQDSVWYVSASAQRVNADANVEGCIAVGMRKYWHGLAAGTYFAGRRLDACINVIHDDVVRVWNFRDDNKILLQPSFKNAVLLLVQDLADPNGQGPSPDTKNNLETIKAALDVALPISSLFSPMIATLGLSGMLVQWLSEMYRSTPDVLRCLMGYIVDVTIVLEVLFWFKVSQPRLPSLYDDDILAAIEFYQRSSSHFKVHQEIRDYVDNMTTLDKIKPDDKTHLKIKELINSHRLSFSDVMNSDTKKKLEPIAEGSQDVQSPKNLQLPKVGSSSVGDSPPRQPLPEDKKIKLEALIPTPKKKSMWSRLLRFFGLKKFFV